jgi:hypothetical protein
MHYLRRFCDRAVLGVRHTAVRRLQLRERLLGSV